MDEKKTTTMNETRMRGKTTCYYCDRCLEEAAREERQWATKHGRKPSKQVTMMIADPNHPVILDDGRVLPAWLNRNAPKVRVKFCNAQCRAFERLGV